MSLTGKTVFISGASRGVGLAIAIRAARDGANVALIAKTAEPHPKLEGTVYTAAEQIHEAGGHALPVVGDIRDRASTTWASFLRSQANALLACDFFETSTVTGARLFVLAAIEHGTRRIRVLGATPHPTASWVVQAARNLVMDLEDADCRARFLIRDRDGKYPALFDAVLKDAGVEVVLSGVQMPRMNAVMERWVLTCRRELLNRTLVWNQRHLLHALREFEQFYRRHRPHQGTAQVLGPGVAAPIAVEAGDRVGAARLQLPAQHVPVTHTGSIPDISRPACAGSTSLGRSGTGARR